MTDCTRFYLVNDDAISKLGYRPLHSFHRISLEPVSLNLMRESRIRQWPLSLAHCTYTWQIGSSAYSWEGKPHRMGITTNYSQLKSHRETYPPPEYPPLQGSHNSDTITVCLTNQYGSYDFKPCYGACLMKNHRFLKVQWRAKKNFNILVWSKKCYWDQQGY